MRLLSLLLAVLLLFASCTAKTGTKDNRPLATETERTNLPDIPEAAPPVPDEAQPEAVGSSAVSTSASTVSDEDIRAEQEAYVQRFKTLNDPDLLLYMEDAVWAGLEESWANDDYIIEDVAAVYVSKEYLEELAFNTRRNIYFGYTLEEIEAQFGDKRYVFTLGEDGTTVVKAFEGYDETFNQVARNVAVGTGVILVCVTVSFVSGSLGMSAVKAIFADGAVNGVKAALSSGAIIGVMNGIVEGIRTKDVESTLKKAALSGSESFKLGAIVGAVAGGAHKAFQLYRPVPTPREAELRALKKYGGAEQRSYLNGEEVAWGTPNATRPDIVRTIDRHLEAIEVKRYDLENPASCKVLHKELLRQVSDRQTSLPSGTTQRIVLNVEGRRYPKKLVEEAVANLRATLDAVYPNIPIDIMGAMV